MAQQLRAVDDGGGHEDGEQLTIEQLAQRTGMTVRNLRSHRTAGLLPPPEVRNRVGYYRAEHVARVELVRELQDEGFNLRSIKRLIEQTGGEPDELLGLRNALAAPWAADGSQVYTAADLVERFGMEIPPEALATAVKLGILVPLDDGNFEAPVPRLVEIAAEVIARGVPLTHALAVIGKVRDRCESIGREFVRLFLDDLWKPFVEAGYPEDRWHEVVDSIERLRPLSSEVVLATYQLVMADEVERAFGRELERLARRK